ncbi:DEAD/DEAH box helicase family protein [Spiroplasma endosymbiont of Danaus chrysippus]|uniref:DEAD/DEAH box helicase family protein n=1 Tax=Spiroplasma endosymbiont of Danaus chrysippus TaxID=2691041 RepID=UPI00157AB873|nr:DEAD/DEAH box helicase family protein [Spiroplasma endosymbiont of Danaus chrysippus]
MKNKGYYDLLLKISDNITNNFQTSHINDEKELIKDIDHYLVKQLNNTLIEQLKTIKSPEAKIDFLNQIISNFTTNKFSNNILLQVNDSIIDNPLTSNIRLSDNYLFTNENQQVLINHLNQEIRTSDEVYFIYPFISNSIINKLRSSFTYALNHNITINFITTTFDDMALFVNLYALVKIIKKYPNIKVKVENNLEKRSERIHIKAAIFKRNSGFSSAIIGSSNLTQKGLASGREWNIKINEFDNKQLYQNILNQYYKLWNDNLVDLNDEQQRLQLLSRIEYNRLLVNKKDEQWLATNYFLYDFQIALINKLKLRRKLKKTKHLIVMATGVGKTVVSAFDYLNQIKENNNQKPSILFLAHQREIIEQAIITFRKVINDKKFATILNSKQNNFQEQYLFATVQTVHRHLNKFKRQQFDIIIFDEAHHLAAKTFQTIFNYFHPKQIIGLTATPEREDNKNIINYFDNEFAHELRLWDAINEKLLSPFDYYCIDDITADLTGIDLNNDQQLFKKLNTEARNKLLLDVINDYIGFYSNRICLIFCINITHAQIVARFLQNQGLKSDFLTSKNQTNRSKIINDFKNRIINYLCVVNIFNEGIDIPEIDTIILLRPTNSKTVYLQQLGRGLRKTETKHCLEVYDLIANIDKKYDITIGIKNLSNSHIINVNKQLTNSFNLPYGCTITLEPRSQNVILTNLKQWYQSRKKIYLVIQSYYQLYNDNAIFKILIDYDLTIQEFYNFLNDFYLRIAKKIKNYQTHDNDTNRNQNILKQFLFLNDYQIVNYFYLRLSQELDTKLINYHYDNLLIASLLYEVTSNKVFNRIFPNFNEIPCLVTNFIENNKLVVNELKIILKYKLDYETLLLNEHFNQDYPLLSYQSTFTVHQALCAINHVNFNKKLGPLKIIAFQAGHLTFNENKSVIFADIDGTNYGKLTSYNKLTKEYYWSIPENKTINSKLVKDLQNNNIEKILFLNNDCNKKFKNLALKLYDFIGIGQYQLTIKSDYITIKFLIE